MKQSLIVLALLGVTEARHHHHHKRVNLVQDDAPVTPASNRATFEAARQDAANTVATQQNFEATKTADVAARNAANTKATFDLRSHMRRARHHQMEGEVHHDQWVTRSDHSNWAQTSTPDDSRKAFEDGVANANAVVAKQKAFEESQTNDITSRHDAQAKATFDRKAAIRAARVDQTRGGAKNSRDSRGWRTVWPIGSLAQTPEESYAAKANNLKLSLETTANQRAEEERRNNEIKNMHDTAASNTDALKLKVRNAQDDQRKGGVHPARDSMGWSVAQ